MIAFFERWRARRAPITYKTGRGGTVTLSPPAFKKGDLVRVTGYDVRLVGPKVNDTVGVVDSVGMVDSYHGWSQSYRERKPQRHYTILSDQHDRPMIVGENHLIKEGS
jgi:hypothetical protein